MHCVLQTCCFLLLSACKIISLVSRSISTCLNSSYMFLSVSYELSVRLKRGAEKIKCNNKEKTSLIAASMSCFFSFYMSGRRERGGWKEGGGRGRGGVKEGGGGALTDEPMAFRCVLQHHSRAKIVLCFPEDSSQASGV